MHCGSSTSLRTEGTFNALETAIEKTAQQIDVLGAQRKQLYDVINIGMENGS